MHLERSLLRRLPFLASEAGLFFNIISFSIQPSVPSLIKGRKNSEARGRILCWPCNFSCKYAISSVYTITVLQSTILLSQYNRYTQVLICAVKGLNPLREKDGVPLLIWIHWIHITIYFHQNYNSIQNGSDYRSKTLFSTMINLIKLLMTHYNNRWKQ